MSSWQHSSRQIFRFKLNQEWVMKQCFNILKPSTCTSDTMQHVCHFHVIYILLLLCCHPEVMTVINQKIQTLCPSPMRGCCIKPWMELFLRKVSQQIALIQWRILSGFCAMVSKGRKNVFNTKFINLQAVLEVCCNKPLVSMFSCGPYKQSLI